MRKQKTSNTLPNTAKREHKWGVSNSRAGKPRKLFTPLPKQIEVMGLYLTGHKHRDISRQLGIDRETVRRIISQQENQVLLSSYRDAVMKIVPEALITAYALVKSGDRQMATDILYGARVLVHRQETETIQPQTERTYAYPKFEFFVKYGRVPSLEEAKEFEKTLKIPLLVQSEIDV